MFWQDNMQKTSMFWNKFQPVLLNSKINQSRPKKVLNHKKCQTEPTTDILFVAIFATKF